MDKVEKKKRVGDMEKEQPAGRKILGETSWESLSSPLKGKKKMLALTTIPGE